LFQLVGGALVAIGTWAFLEKNKFEYANEDEGGSNFDLYDIAFDLSIITIIIGGIVFIVSFLGCIGALRENLCFLKTVSCGFAVNSHHKMLV
jgi:tetraspanin-33